VADGRNAAGATPVVLASSSPRRRELRDTLGVEFTVAPADIDESVLAGEPAVAYVHRLALAKAATVASTHTDQLVIAADTTVDVDGEILGKPSDAADARRMLRLLAGRSHRVHTGLAVRIDQRVAAAVQTTVVVFAALDESLIDWYLATGEPFDKAGGYAIQGRGGVLVERIDGSFSNVVGLPLALLVQLSTKVGAPLLP
jgi:septum formation protein